MPFRVFFHPSPDTLHDARLSWRGHGALHVPIGIDCTLINIPTNPLDPRNEIRCSQTPVLQARISEQQRGLVLFSPVQTGVLRTTSSWKVGSDVSAVSSSCCSKQVGTQQRPERF